MPKMAVAVVIENARPLPGTNSAGGSSVAGPIARRVLDSYLLTPEQWQEAEQKRREAEEKRAKAAAASAPRRGTE